MRLYRLTRLSPNPADVPLNTKWVGTQADAASARKTWVTAGAKRDEIVTDEVDVPTDKQGLLEFLNALGR